MMSGRIFEMRDKLKQGLEKEGKFIRMNMLQYVHVGECVCDF